MKTQGAVVGLAFSIAFFGTTAAFAVTDCPAGTPVCTEMDGSLCLAQQQVYNQNGAITYNANNFSVDLNTVGSGVVCPIWKNTSASGVTNDDLSSVTMNVFSPGGASGLTCNLFVYDAAIAVNSSHTPQPNWKQTYPGVFTPAGGSNFTVTFAPKSGQSAVHTFWKSSTDWLYAQIVCSAVSGMSVGNPAVIDNYFVAEKGTIRTQRIYSVGSNCGFGADGLLGNLGGYTFVDGEGIVGGYVEGTEYPSSDPSANFEWDCSAMDDNVTAEFQINGSTQSVTTIRGTDVPGGNVITINPPAFNFPTVYHSKNFNNVTYSFSVQSLARGDLVFTSFRTH